MPNDRPELVKLLSSDTARRITEGTLTLKSWLKLASIGPPSSIGPEQLRRRAPSIGALARIALRPAHQHQEPDGHRNLLASLFKGLSKVTRGS